MNEILQAAVIDLGSFWVLAANAIGWVFTLGLTFGYFRARLLDIDKRVQRVESYLDSNTHLDSN